MLDLVLVAGEMTTETVSLTINPFCIRPIDVDVVASDPDALVVNRTGILVNACGGDTSSFDVQITGTGAAQAFDLVFLDAEFGGVLGAIPVTITPPVSLGAIDIKPGSDVNPINPMSRGVIPVAILGGSLFTVVEFFQPPKPCRTCPLPPLQKRLRQFTFDAHDVDLMTLAFGPEAAAPKHKKGGHPEDVNDDGITDLVSHYPTQETGIIPGDTEACVTGELLDGTPFEGCDGVLVLGPCGLGFELAFLLPGVMWLHRRRRAERGGPGCRDKAGHWPPPTPVSAPSAERFR